MKRKVKKPAHGVPIRTEIPLHVIRPEPYEPTITTADSPPAYDFDRKYEFDRPHGFDPGRVEFDRPDGFYRTDEFDRRDDLDRRDFFGPPDGFDRRDDFGYRDNFDRKDEFDIGYAKYNGYTDHNMAYDDEPLVRSSQVFTTHQKGPIQTRYFSSAELNLDRPELTNVCLLIQFKENESILSAVFKIFTL